jgi:hypothetical protein
MVTSCFQEAVDADAERLAAVRNACFVLLSTIYT